MVHMTQIARRVRTAIRRRRGVASLVAISAIAAAAAALATPVGTKSNAASSANAQPAHAVPAGASPRAKGAPRTGAAQSPSPSPKVSKPAATAKATTDLTVTVVNKVDAAAGKRVTYSITVLNHGPSRAHGVEIVFITSSYFKKKVQTKITNGYCERAHMEAICHWNRSLKAGGSALVSISGVMPADIATGTQVTNHVSVRSTTKRVNQSDDKASDNYLLGLGRTPLVAAPSPTPNPSGKLAQISNTAAKVANYTTHAVLWTFIALGAAALWFAVGLALHHRRRTADADFDNNDDEE